MENPDRKHAVELIAHLDSTQLAAVVRLLEVMTGPVTRSLVEGPFEEEEISAELAAELDAAVTSPASETISHDALLRRYGLTPR